MINAWIHITNKRQCQPCTNLGRPPCKTPPFPRYHFFNSSIVCELQTVDPATTYPMTSLIYIFLPRSRCPQPSCARRLPIHESQFLYIRSQKTPSLTPVVRFRNLSSIQIFFNCCCGYTAVNSTPLVTSSCRHNSWVPTKTMVLD